MLPLYDSVWIDQNVAAELIDVASGQAQPTAAEQQFKIPPPRRRAENGPPAAALHAVGSIEFARLVEEDRPRECGFASVRLRNGKPLERYHGHLNLESLQLRFVLLQLQQVLAAGKSRQVPVKDEQQPAAGIIS